jgi:hypothetical protein
MSKAIEEMLAQYEANQKKTSTSERKEYDKDKYFSTYLEKGVNSKTMRVRILPSKDGGSAIEQLMMHSIETKVDGKTEYPKYVCPKWANEEDCPFCETRQQLYAQGSDDDKKLANKFGARLVYVVKLIDREHEDKIKFWRFNHSYANNGIFDKIIGILKVSGDITDPNTGSDIQITVGRDQLNKPIVQSLVNFPPSPLSLDKDKMKEWLDNDEKWEDVYAGAKPYDYLKIIIEGGTPRWDKDKECYVDKDSVVAGEDMSNDNNNSLTIGGGANTLTTPVNNTTVNDSNADSQNSDEEEEDLPF